MSALAKVLLLLALSPSVQAIQSQSARNSTGLTNLNAERFPRIERELKNHQDTLYTAELVLGGQPMRGILDTGSFELVVFGKKCKTCGTAVAYDDAHSSTYEEGTEKKKLGYGSGVCSAGDGYDSIKLSGAPGLKQAFWEASECDMPLLDNAEFNAIVGIGPPGEPIFEAKHEIESYEKEMGANQEDIFSDFSRPHLRKALKKAKHKLEVAKTKTDLLDNLAVTRFSTCFGRPSGSPGLMIWNDESPQGKPGVVSVPVAGEVTWSIKIEGATFTEGTKEVAKVGCFEKGCGAIVDTGTTLLGVDSNFYNAVFDAIQDMETDCSDLRKFPDLTFNLGNGKTLTLPPDAYISEVYGMSKDMKSLWQKHDETPFVDERPMNLRTRADGQKVMCQLMIMDMGETMTTLGYQTIIGMSIFREYYTTFDLGKEQNGNGRMIHFAPATESCEPSYKSNQTAPNLREAMYPVRPKQVDASKVKVPTRWSSTF